MAIASGGQHKLTSNLIAPTPAPTNQLITISSGGVDLDLNRHSFLGRGTCMGPPMTSCSGAAASAGTSVDLLRR